MNLSKAFEAYYLDGDRAFFNKCENRMRLLEERLEMGIFPWMWDWEHYSGENENMIGFFYAEDIANLEQIDHYKREYARHHRSK